MSGINYLEKAIPVYTVILDNVPTATETKFKCEQCEGTVFTYWGHILHKFDFDVFRNPSPEAQQYVQSKTPPEEVECTHFIQSPSGYRRRCRTFYMLIRTQFETLKIGKDGSWLPMMQS